MPYILAIDTSTHACSCALSLDNQIFETFDIIPRLHAKMLLPMVDALLKAHAITFNDLDAVAYGQGPGSFTGLRIAAGVAQGIAFGADLPVVPVSSLAAMAFQLRLDNPGLVFSTLDARIDEIYWGFYQVSESQVELVGEESLCKPEALPESMPDHESPLCGVGSGLEFIARMPASFQRQIKVQHPDIHPRAGVMAQLATGYLANNRVQRPEEVNPVYLRDKVTHV